MDVTLLPRSYNGVADAVPSKEEAQRVILATALAGGGALPKLPDSGDIRAMLRCAGAISSGGTIDCGESGSALRLGLPVMAALGVGARFTGRGRLPERPIAELMRALYEHGARFDSDSLPFTLSGKLEPGRYEITGSVSSQYISGLLFALPLLTGDSELCVTSAPVSSRYIGMTVEVLRRFGVETPKTARGYAVPGGQRYKCPESLALDGDWTDAAAFLALGALSGLVEVRGLDLASWQGDRAFCGILRRFGAYVTARAAFVSAEKAPLSPVVMNVTDTPDLLPVLAVLASQADGVSVFTGAARLRHKESDRLEATAAMLRALGGDVEITGDGLLVTGSHLRGGVTDSFGDHRVAMAAAAASSVCASPVTIKNAEAVEKSHPSFFEELAAIGE